MHDIVASELAAGNRFLNPPSTTGGYACPEIYFGVVEPGKVDFGTADHDEKTLKTSGFCVVRRGRDQ